LHLAQTLVSEGQIILKVPAVRNRRTRRLAILLRGRLGLIRPRVVLMARVSRVLALGDAGHVVMGLVRRGDRGTEADAADQLAAVLHGRVEIDVDDLAGPGRGIRAKQRRHNAEIGTVGQVRLITAPEMDGQLFVEHFADGFLCYVEDGEVNPLRWNVGS